VPSAPPQPVRWPGWRRSWGWRASPRTRCSWWRRRWSWYSACCCCPPRAAAAAMLSVLLGLAVGLGGPRPASAHDPGQGDLVASARLTGASDGRRSLNLTVDAAAGWDQVTPVRLVARRAGQTIAGPLSRADACRYIGSVSVPDPRPLVRLRRVPRRHGQRRDLAGARRRPGRHDRRRPCLVPAGNGRLRAAAGGRRRRDHLPAGCGADRLGHPAGPPHSVRRYYHAVVMFRRTGARREGSKPPARRNLLTHSARRARASADGSTTWSPTRNCRCDIGPRRCDEPRLCG
jgi:hypothetical protein